MTRKGILWARALNSRCRGGISRLVGLRLSSFDSSPRCGPRDGAARKYQQHRAELLSGVGWCTPVGVDFADKFCKAAALRRRPSCAGTAGLAAGPPGGRRRPRAGIRSAARSMRSRYKALAMRIKETNPAYALFRVALKASPSMKKGRDCLREWQR